MVEGGTWQRALINDLVALLRPDRDMVALVLGGSTVVGGQKADEWSDVDVLLVVNEGALRRFHPALDWLTPLGEVYAFSQSATPISRTTRICFADFRRLDVVITTEAGLAEVAPGWSAETETLFSRSQVVDWVLADTYTRPAPPLISDEQFAALVNDFWFKAMLALTKVVRDDLLIALHLTLDLVRDCCVLAMLLRDRAEGTNIHRGGGIGNDAVARLEPTRQPYTASGILDSLEQSAVAFDELAARWTIGYEAKRGPLLAAIGKAREAWRADD